MKQNKSTSLTSANDRWTKAKQGQWKVLYTEWVKSL